MTIRFATMTITGEIKEIKEIREIGIDFLVSCGRTSDFLSAKCDLGNPMGHYAPYNAGGRGRVESASR